MITHQAADLKLKTVKLLPLSLDAAQVSRVGPPSNSELLTLQCVPFFCLFSLFLFLSGLSHQDSSSILLSFPNTIAKGCVLSFPLAFSVPTNQQLLCCKPGAPPLAETQKASPPTHTHLLVAISPPCSSDNCWDVWSTHLCSVLSSH